MGLVIEGQIEGRTKGSKRKQQISVRNGEEERERAT